MAVVISDNVLLSSQMAESEIKVEIAMMLFQKNKLTLGQASEFAEISQFEFQHLLASRQIPIHYFTEDLEKDLNNLRDYIK